MNITDCADYMRVSDHEHSIMWRDSKIAMLEAENAELREVVDGIAQMCRLKMQRSLERELTYTEYCTEFTQWAQSICRHALTPPKEEEK